MPDSLGDKASKRRVGTGAVLVAAVLTAVVIAGMGYVAFFRGNTSPPCSVSKTTSSGPPLSTEAAPPPKPKPNLPKCPEMSEADRAEFLARVRPPRKSGEATPPGPPCWDPWGVLPTLSLLRISPMQSVWRIMAGLACPISYRDYKLCI